MLTLGTKLLLESASSGSSSEEDSRNLKKRVAENVAGALPGENESASFAHPGRALGKRRGLRARESGEASESSATPAASTTPISCCWMMNEQTKKYQYYVRPANAACVAGYKLAQCPKGRCSGLHSLVQWDPLLENFS